LNQARQPASDMHTALPLFPLPEYTLFPNTLVPFHVYEPVYQQMLSDSVAGRRLVVVAALSEGWEADETSTETVTTGGLGRILSDRRYPDGRVDLFVHGIARVQITRRTTGQPWTEVDVKPIPDQIESPLDSAFHRLLVTVSQLRGTLGDEGELLGEVLASTTEPAVLTNRLASVLVTEYGLRQTLLQTRCPAARCHQLVETIGHQLLASDEAGGTWAN
jgi:Lon protease-like protein